MSTGKTVSLQRRRTRKRRRPGRYGKATTQRKSEVRLGREVQARIGQQLRALYDEVVSQGVPQHIADLVRRLSEQDEGAA